jgi:hypothetical protein
MPAAARHSVQGAEERDMKQMLHKTIVLRKCLNCESTMGIGVWPWSGQRFTVSHGLCQGCFDELEAAALASEADTAPRRGRPQDPPAAEAWYNASGI